jgi:CheY-like chemotaxis protein/drug/metabolite transporter (DMT)-like permease
MRQVCILVVDDNLLARRKLTLAAKALGHTVEDVDNGDAALERLLQPGIDIVLLDIEMPVKSGYDVLDALGQYPAELRRPVIVVSSLDEPEEIARAIELGAVDFLPKSFNAVILKARINACLREARRQEEDRRTLLQIERLTIAAEELDADEMNPRDLDIDDLIEQDGALTVLSRVLLNKSILVYNRRKHQTHQIQTLRCILLLLLIGACFGIRPALANRLIAADQALWVTSLLTLCITTIILTVFALLQSSRFVQFDWRSGRIVLLLAIFGPFLPLVLLMGIAGSVSSVIISIALALEAFMVSIICAGMGIERITRRRLLGLLLGLAGVLMVLWPSLSLGNDSTGLIVAICIPACYAVRTVLLRTEAVASHDPVSLASSFYILAVILSIAALLASGAFPTLQMPSVEVIFTLSIFSIAEATGIIALIYLVRIAGPVFASQKSFTVAVGGVIWSILLLGTGFTLLDGLSIVFLLAGLALVANLPPSAELFEKPQK